MSTKARIRHGRGFPISEAAYLLREGTYLPDYPIELVASAWQENYDRAVERQQFSDAELQQLAAALKIVIGTHGAEVLPETVERMRALRTKCLSLAFMEVSRDA